MTDKIRIKTKFNPSQIILETTFPGCGEMQDIIVNTTRQVIDLQDQAVTAALANLGYVKQEWISVKDRLPEKNKNVILAVEGLTYQVCYGFYECSMFHIFYTNGAFPNNRVTHWMPLPEPPEAVLLCATRLKD